MSKKQRGEYKLAPLQRVPLAVINGILFHFLTPKDLVKLSITSSHMQQLREPMLAKMEKEVLPEIEWMCENKVCSKLSKKQVKELNTNLEAGIRVCEHQRWSGTEKTKLIKRADKHSTEKKNFALRTNHYDGFLCFCNIRRFVPIIKKTVSGEDTIHSYTRSSVIPGQDGACRCLHSRPSDLIATRQPLNYNICGTYAWYIPARLSEREQLLKLLEIVHSKLLQPANGGLRNPLIREWLTKVHLLSAFE